MCEYVPTDEGEEKGKSRRKFFGKNLKLRIPLAVHYTRRALAVNQTRYGDRMYFAHVDINYITIEVFQN